VTVTFKVTVTWGYGKSAGQGMISNCPCGRWRVWCRGGRPSAPTFVVNQRLIDPNYPCLFEHLNLNLRPLAPHATRCHLSMRGRWRAWCKGGRPGEAAPTFVVNQRLMDPNYPCLFEHLNLNLRPLAPHAMRCHLSMWGDGESLTFTPLEMIIIRLGSDDLNGCRFFYW
jgi:hypothetical protein